MTVPARLASLCAVSAALPLAAGGGADTQLFTPARYALVAAEVDTASLQPGTGGPTGRRQVLVKLDTVSGRCWVLQLAVAGADNPTVIGASWAAVAEAVSNPRAAMPGGNPLQNNGGGNGF